MDLTSAVAVNVSVIFFQTNNVLQHRRDKCASLPEWGILAHKTPGCFKFFVRLCSSLEFQVFSLHALVCK